MMQSSEKHQSVKAVHVNRDRIKERIQEKHRQQRRQVREGRLSGLREADGSAERGETAWGASGAHSDSNQHYGAVGSSGAHAQDAVPCYNPDGSLLLPAVQDWSDIGNEFGVNIHDVDVMEYLLALEDEIRQEQLFQFYDQANGNEWEEYYRSLMS